MIGLVGSWVSAHERKQDPSLWWCGEMGDLLCLCCGIGAKGASSRGWLVGCSSLFLPLVVQYRSSICGRKCTLSAVGKNSKCIAFGGVCAGGRLFSRLFSALFTMKGQKEMSLNSVHQFFDRAVINPSVCCPGVGRSHPQRQPAGLPGA